MARQAKKNDRDRARLLIRIIFGLSLLGLLLTVHLWIQSERGFSRGCFGFDNPEDVGIVECTAVVQSDAGKLFGISNIVYGFFFFASIAALAFASIIAREETAKTVRKVSLIFASIGVAYALYLFSVQVFVLQMFCKLCLTTGLTTAVLFGLHAVEWAGKSVPKYDVAEMVREIGLYILMTLIAGMLLVAAVFFVNRIGTLETQGPTSVSTAPPPASSTDPSDTGSRETAKEEEVAQADPEQVRAELERVCRYEPGAPAISGFASLTNNAPMVGDADAPVTLVEFFDPNCPHCKTLHERMPQIMSQIGDRAKLYYRPYPIWPYSYAQIEALYLAEDAGRFDAMLDAQMERQKRGGLSVNELVEIAEDIGLDAEDFRRDLNGGKYRTRVNGESVQIRQLGVNSVPKVALEGRFVQSASVNGPCLDYLIDEMELEG